MVSAATPLGSPVRVGNISDAPALSPDCSVGVALAVQSGRRTLRLGRVDPMLHYFANGRIRWKEPPRCNTRTNWEFYAVIEGRCAPVLEGCRPTLKTRTLWIFPPECSHAWTDDGQRSFHRIALHFGTVPYPLDEIVRAQGFLAKALTDGDIARLKAIAAELEPHYVRPNQISPLHFQGRLMDLAALALAGQEHDASPALPSLAQAKVERALSWYAEHLSRAPALKEVADAIHVSSCHLRRLFWQVRRMSPRAAFQRLRVEKAKEMMSRSALTLDDVARHCGYASASHLHREFRRFHRFTPTRWRMRLVASFSDPLPAGVVPVRQFSARPEERAMTA